MIIPKGKKPKTTKEDIYIFKKVNIIGKRIYTSFQMFEMEVGYTYEADIEIINSWAPVSDDKEEQEAISKHPKWIRILTGDYQMVVRGFSGTLDVERAQNYDGDKVVRCLVPKGSKIIHGYTGLVVVSRIKLMGFL